MDSGLLIHMPLDVTKELFSVLCHVLAVIRIIFN